MTAAETLRGFLTTDLHRVTSALADLPVTDDTARRLDEHLHRLGQVIAMLTGIHPGESPPMETMDTALDLLHDRTSVLLDAIETLDEQRLNATVFDPESRNLTVLGQLVDYTRLSAMLVEWSRSLEPAPTVEDWFGSSG